MTTIGVAWVSLTQSLAIIALILTALGLMLGIVKPVDALKHIDAILGIVVLLMLVPDVLTILSIRHPYILLSATVPEDPGYFGKKLIM